MKTMIRILTIALSILGGSGLSYAQWVPTAGPTGGFIESFAAVPDGAGGTDLLAGTYYGGVFLSTDAGTSWKAANTGLTNLLVLSVAGSPNEAGGATLFAGTNGSGVFRSTDMGRGWTQVAGA